jgi:hypothetical protein
LQKLLLAKIENTYADNDIYLISDMCVVLSGTGGLQEQDHIFRNNNLLGQIHILGTMHAALNFFANKRMRRLINLIIHFFYEYIIRAAAAAERSSQPAFVFFAFASQFIVSDLKAEEIRKVSGCL